MREYLVLRLYGPMASWGGIAVGEQRNTSVHPSRSALLGLVSGALGIRRDDHAALIALSSSIRFGVKMRASGMPMQDYHTVQWTDVPKKFAYRTRAQELRDKGKLKTILTSREYRCDSLFVVAIALAAGAPWTLEQLAEALWRPHFVPYLGRKSCTLGLPLDPRVGAFDSLKAALDSRDEESLVPMVPAWESARLLSLDRKARYFWDQGMENVGMKATLMQTRHDEPLSRTRWQFESRQECVYLAGGPR